MNLIGHSSPSFCHDGIEETASRIQDQGFDVWEIVAEGLHDVWERRKRFQAVLPSFDLEVQVHAPLSDCNIGSLLPKVWEHSLRTVSDSLRGAADIGAKVVTLHPGNHTPLSRGHYPELHEATRAALKRLDAVGQDLGLTLCLENMAPSWAFETAQLEQLEDLVASTELVLCFDLGHAHVGKRLPEFVSAAKELGNVHVHDNKGDHDAHLPLDAGTVPWKKTVKALLAAGYRGAFILETNAHSEGETGLPLLRDALA